MVFRITRTLFALTLLSASAAHAQFNEGPFKAGDSIQFQWGADQVAATVKTAFGDQLIVRFSVDGKSQSASLRAANAQNPISPAKNSTHPASE